MVRRALLAVKLLTLLSLLALSTAPRLEAGDDLAGQVARLQEQVLSLQKAMAVLLDRLRGGEVEVQHLRLRVDELEAYVEQLKAAFRLVAPSTHGDSPQTARPQVSDGRVDAMEILSEGRSQHFAYRIVSGAIRGLPSRSRLELAVSLSDAGGIVQRTFTTTSKVVAENEVLWLEGRITLSTDGDKDNWFRNLLGRDGRPDREKYSKIVVTFLVLNVLPP